VIVDKTSSTSVELSSKNPPLALAINIAHETHPPRRVGIAASAPLTGHLTSLIFALGSS